MDIATLYDLISGKWMQKDAWIYYYTLKAS
jgi:hypothetical protein